MTCSSAALKELAEGSGSLRRSISCRMSKRSLAARQSPLSDWLTSCLLMAWRLLIFLRPPFSAFESVFLQRGVRCELAEPAAVYGFKAATRHKRQPPKPRSHRRPASSRASSAGAPAKGKRHVGAMALSDFTFRSVAVEETTLLFRLNRYARGRVPARETRAKKITWNRPSVRAVLGRAATPPHRGPPLPRTRAPRSARKLARRQA
jgi:hypothetical protein